MKQLKVIIQPDKLGAVKSALAGIGLKGLNVGKIEGFAQDRVRKLTVRSAEYTIDIVPMVTVDTVIEDAVVEDAIKAITKAAQTGRSGDGRIFVSDVTHSVNIRNGETDVEAITRTPFTQSNVAA